MRGADKTYTESRQTTAAAAGSYTYGLSSSLLNAAGSGLSILSSSLASANKALTAGAHQLASAGESPKGDRERVEFVKFSWLERDAHAQQQRRLVLLVGYQTGFQVWDVEDGSKKDELVSRRDGPVRFETVLDAPLLLTILPHSRHIRTHWRHWAMALIKVAPWGGGGVAGCWSESILLTLLHAIR